MSYYVYVIELEMIKVLKSAKFRKKILIMFMVKNVFMSGSQLKHLC